MNKSASNHKTYRSFFWPVILLGAGVIWLLVNLGILPTTNLWLLLQLWPVLIILAGLDVLFSRHLSLLGAFLALLLIAGVIFILLNGERLNLEGRPDPQQESFVVPLDDIETAHFDLELSTQDTRITALENTDNLVEAEIGYFGDLDFRVTGEQEKWITLEQEAVVSLPSLFSPVDEELFWNISLSPMVPFDLDVDASTGEADLDLSGILLTNLRFDGSTGASEIRLPESTASYDAYIVGSTGTIDLVLPREGNISLRVDGSTGVITFDIPENLQVRIEVIKGGTGNIILPDWISKVSGAQDRDEGVYVSDGTDADDPQISIIIEDIGTGNIVIN